MKLTQQLSVPIKVERNFLNQLQKKGFETLDLWIPNTIGTISVDKNWVDFTPVIRNDGNTNLKGPYKTQSGQSGGFIIETEVDYTDPKSGINLACWVYYTVPDNVVIPANGGVYSPPPYRLPYNPNVLYQIYILADVQYSMPNSWWRNRSYHIPWMF